MRELFELDMKDYDRADVKLVRNSARAIIIRGGKVAMIHSGLYNYYKFPGGGIEEGESNEQAVIRETAEEAGLVVSPMSIREFGYVHRIQKEDRPGYDVFVQDNFYYLCDILPGRVEQALDEYESEERFTLKWVAPEEAIRVDREGDHGDKQFPMLEREARVLEILIAEGFFDR